MTAAYPDGSVIPLPQDRTPANPSGTNDLLTIFRFGSRIGKTPTERYYHGVHQRFDAGRTEFLARMSENDLSPIRWEAPEEYPQNIPKTLHDRPELQSLQNPDVYPSGVVGGCDASTLRLHFLMIFKMHFLALRAALGPAIPEAAFVYFQRPDGHFEPAVVQEAIDGTRLSDMMSRDWEHVPTGLAPPWQEHAALLQQVLTKYCDSPDLIDFNLMNFIFVPGRKALYYVESKPPFFRSARRNTLNQALIQKFFVRCEPAAFPAAAHPPAVPPDHREHRSWLGRFLRH